MICLSNLFLNFVLYNTVVKHGHGKETSEYNRFFK